MEVIMKKFLKIFALILFSLGPIFQAGATGPDAVSKRGVAPVCYKEFFTDLFLFTFRERMLLGEMSGGSFFGGPHIKKINLNQGDTLLVMGDIHGNYPSLERNIKLWQHWGHLDENLILAPQAYLVFTGDLADRGKWGVEVWQNVLRLSLRNPGRVIIARGNHENSHCATRYGFKFELYDKNMSPLFPYFLEVFDLLPSAVFLQVGNSFIQVNHGGMPIGHSRKIADFLRNKDKVVKKIDDEICRAYLWGDYMPGDKIVPSHRGKDIYKVGVHNVKHVVLRGHEHQPHAISHMGKNGWEGLVPRVPMPLNSHNVYTFTSLPSRFGGKRGHDCFGIVRIGDSCGTSTITPYEIPITDVIRP